MSILRAERHQRNIDDVTALAIAETVSVMNSLEGEPVPRAAYALREVIPDIAETYGAAAGDLSVNYYDEVRATSDARTPYSPTVANIGINERIQNAIGYSMAQTTTGTSWAIVTSVLAGNVQNTVSQVDRSTLSFNIVTDPDGTVYQRVPSASACAFCRTMASVARPTEESYTHFHSFCRCRSVPVFRGQEPVEIPGAKQTQDAYSLATKELERQREEVGYLKLKRRVAANLYPDLTLTTKNHLRLMRELTGWS
jgi:hypothetical protein